mmetsp:Transcript_41023/g.130373  ORF Transcript_41023/g.130373 Transcript_41023/m.130373 type:complete len:241 (-) Transcript_41023:771-1493(-)
MRRPACPGANNAASGAIVALRSVRQPAAPAPAPKLWFWASDFAMDGKRWLGGTGKRARSPVALHGGRVSGSPFRPATGGSNCACTARGLVNPGKTMAKALRCPGKTTSTAFPFRAPSERSADAPHPPSPPLLLPVLAGMLSPSPCPCAPQPAIVKGRNRSCSPWASSQPRVALASPTAASSTTMHGTTARIATATEKTNAKPGAALPSARSMTTSAAMSDAAPSTALSILCSYGRTVSTM